MSPRPAERRARATSGRRQGGLRSGAEGTRASGFRARSSPNGLVFALIGAPSRPQTQASGQPYRTYTCARSRAGPPAAPPSAPRSPRPRSPQSWGARAGSARPSPTASGRSQSRTA
eukprot:1920633-Alexandrium_andersonii.AAC.1